MANVLLVICLLLYSCVIVESQNLVSCYNDARCSQGDPVTSTINDCCNHVIDPPGVSYTALGMEGCEVCPRIFGFFETSFSAIECGDAYMQQVGTISGPKIHFARLNVELDKITIGDGDLDLTTSSVNVFSGSDPVNISFLFTKDYIAQEIDEIFTLTLVDQGNFLAGYTTRLVLTGTILDDDIESFKIAENDFSACEGLNAMIQVKINKERLSFRLANAVTFKVYPLTIAAAIAESIVVPQETLRMDDDSPVQANEEDFNTTVFEVVFPADELIDPVGSVDAFISVVDDDINENSEQLFVVVVEAAGAINSRLLSITRNLTICRLMDNDPITIGFELRTHIYTEPDVPLLISDVALVKEGNRLTEQTFSVAIGIDTSAVAREATLGSDFTITRINDAGSLSLLFPPSAERISLNFFLQPDLIAEGDEAFLAFISPSEMSIVYSPPNAFSSVFRSTMITIIDNDPAIAGFEMSLYFVNESAGVQEVCIVVTNPAMDQPLNLAIPVQYSTLPGSAGEDDFTAGPNRVFVFVDSGPGMPNIRRMCAEIRITNDSDLENVESFTLSLMALASGIEVSPNVTEIRILDDDVIVESQNLVSCYNDARCSQGDPVMSIVNDCCNHGIDPPGVAYSIPGMEVCEVCPRVIVESQNLVSCYNDAHCSQGDPVTSTINDCCNHDIDPPGVSYTAPGMGGCEVCPRVFGFFETSFSAIERGDAYLQQVGTISGPKINFARLNVELDKITIGDGDLDLTTMSVNVFTGSDPVKISFLFIKDLIAQEIDETFTLTLVDQGNFLAGYLTRLVLTGTILDEDIESFKIAENDFSACEGLNAMMQVKINKEQLSLRLANALTIKVYPLTIAAAMARSIVVPQETLRMDDDSPVQANEEDFNTTLFEVVFPADEFIDPVGSVDAFISVVEDDINENSEQLFVAFIEVAGAINSRLLSITRNVTICRIMDNDPITIGFELRAYTYTEPDVPLLISDVALVKEGNRLTEQTFSVAIGIDPSAVAREATLGSDFTITRINDAGSLSLLFPPSAERISLNFFLQPDQIAEGDEAFLAFSSRSEMSIVYWAPNALSSVFRSTMITIIDNDPSIAGFEMPLHFVNESAGVQEVCVVVTNPALDQPLYLAIPVQYSTVPGSAGEDDFTAGPNRIFVFADSGPGMPNIRRMCAEIRITNDSDLENVESFTLSLMALASGIEVSPNVTEIRILDDDGT